MYIVSLKKIILIFIILITILSSSIFAQNSENLLTDKEKAFLDNHGAVKIGFLTNMPPFSFIYKGEHKGFSKEYFDLIVNKTGMEYRKIFGTWSELYEMFKSGDLDVIADISYRKDRTKFTLFTKPYYIATLGVYTSDTFGIYNNISDIADKHVGVVDEVFYEEVLKKNFQSMDIITYESTEAVLKGLSTAEIDAAVVNVNLGNFEALLNKLENIRLAGRLNYKGIEDEDVRFGIKKQLPMLHSIFKKSMLKISSTETAHLLNKWINATPEKLKNLLPFKYHVMTHKIMDKKGFLTYCTDNEFRPLYFKEKGHYKGILPDIFDKFSREYDVRIKHSTPPEGISCNEFFAKGKVDFVPYSPANITEKTILTDTFTDISIAFVAHNKKIYSANTSDMTGGKVAIIENHPATGIIRQNYPLFNFVEVGDVADCLKKVHSKRVKGCVATVPEISHYIRDRQGLNIVISDILEKKFPIKLVLNSESENLKKVINSIIGNINKNELTEIVRNWSPSNYKSGIDIRMFFYILLAFFVIIAFLYFRGKYLKKLHTESERYIKVLSNILNGISEPISMIDKDYNVIFVNETFKKYSDKDYVPHKTKCYHYTEQSDDVCPGCLAKEAFEKGEMIVNEKFVRWKSGKESVYEVRHYPVTDRKGNIEMLVQVMVDIGEKKEFENLKLRNQQLESIAQLAGGIAHDFNNILAAVFGYVEVAKIQAGEGTPPASTLQKVLNYLDNAKSLTNKLLTFSKGGEPHERYADISDIVEKACKHAVRNKNTQYNIQCGIDNTFGTFDSEQIYQAFLEICKNSVEAMHGEGEILVNISLEQMDKPNKFNLSPGKYFKIAFRDQGGGIPTKIKGSVFAPYVTTKQKTKIKGQGLGLSITHSIIMSHNGAVNCKTDWQRWTEFVVYLPAKQDEKDMDEFSREVFTRKENQKQNSHKKILLLDDDQSIGQMFTDMMESLGHSVIYTSTPEECIKVFEKKVNSKGFSDFDFVFLDLTLGSDKSGFDVGQSLQKIDTNPVYVLISGYSEKDKALNYKENGFNHFIQKPFSLDTIKSVIYPKN